MKAVILFLPFLLSILLPEGQHEGIREIHFESFSRGYQKTLVLRPDSIHFREQNPKTGDMEASRKTGPAEWQQLMQAVSGLSSLAALEKLESPGSGRASDRALHSRISIKTNKGEYNSREFDGYNPHKKLAPLVAQIREIENNTNPSRQH